MTRHSRDLLAEAMRDEALGPAARPIWSALGPREIGYREEWARRADHVLRLLSRLGVELVVTGELSPRPSPPEARVIWRGVLADKEDGRAIVRGPADRFLITSLIGGEERTEQSFNLHQAHVNAGLILIDDQDVRKVQGVMKQVAGALEIYRVGADRMEGAPDAG